MQREILARGRTGGGWSAGKLILRQPSLFTGQRARGGRTNGPRETDASEGAGRVGGSVECFSSSRAGSDASVPCSFRFSPRFCCSYCSECSVSSELFWRLADPGITFFGGCFCFGFGSCQAPAIGAFNGFS